ncbi:MAG: RNA polymerase factor sigma-54 [Alphaproteobacteria bacterium]|nr:RNA polymerase factor sigma-54 [Alphaproteobacteria bacterium]
MNRLAPRLDLRQTQQLVMTPQLQQAIKLLQLSNQEVSQFVEEELAQNPLLERDEPGAESAPPEVADAGGTEAATPANGTGEERLLDPVDANATTTEAPLDVDYDNSYSRGADEPAGEGEYLGDWKGSGGRSDFEDSEFGIEQTLARPVSLRDHLLSQVGVDFATPVERVIAARLVDAIDDCGYLTAATAEIADKLGVSEGEVLAVLERCQRFDPPGIFARSLKECLALQLRERDRLDPCMQKLLDNLELLAKRDVAQLQRICNTDLEDIQEMVAEIRTLDPKPGLAFDGALASPVVPDVLMRLAPDHSWIVELNQDTLPRVLVNTRYHARVHGSARSKNEKEFIAERLHAANWLVKSLHQRAQTILKVSVEIVRQQDGFFRHGVRHLKPLVLRDIAEAIDMHESTVSRVTTNKFISTPHGIFELKYFFTSAIPASGGGEAHSAEAVRHRIKALIDAETVKDVLSDDRIVELLKGDGIDIARRTVAKYREAMGIASSVQRRREKGSGF